MKSDLPARLRQRRTCDSEVQRAPKAPAGIGGREGCQLASLCLLVNLGGRCYRGGAHVK